MAQPTQIFTYPEDIRNYPNQLKLMIYPKIIDIKQTLDYLKENLKNITEETPESKKNEILSFKTSIPKNASFIVLPMPAGFSTNLSHTWTEDETLSASLGANIQILLDNLNPIKKARSIIAGTSTYQPKTSHYESTTPLEFTFEWKFTPKSQREVVSIYNITKVFQMGSMPKGIGKFGFVKPPHLFDLKFTNTKKYKHYYFKNNKIEDTAIINANVNYTPDGDFYPFLDGTPTTLTMSVTFRYTRNVIDYIQLFGKEADVSPELNNLLLGTENGKK